MATLPFAVIPVPFSLYIVNNERTEKPAANLAQFKHVGLTWRTNGATSISIFGDFGAATAVDFMSLLLTNATASTTVTLILSNDSAFATSTTVVNASLIRYGQGADRSGFYTSHNEFASQTYRYFQLQIASHTGDFEAAKLVIGKKIVPTTFYDPAFEQGVEDRGSLEIGRYGVVSEDPGVIFRVLKMKFSWLTKSDYEDKFRPLDEKLGKRGVAFWCFDPTADAYRQNNSYFGWLREPPYATGAVKNTRFEKEYQVLSML